MTEEQMKERKKMLCDLMDNDLYVPMKIKELAILLDIPKEKRSDLQEVLDQLMLEGKVEVSQKGKYSKGKGKLLAGVFTAHAKGFGFVTVEGMEEDIFIGEDNTHGAMHQDTVQVMVKPGISGKRREGVVTKILSRGTVKLVGVYQESKNYGFVIPDNERFIRDVFIPKEQSKGAMNGHKVVVELTDYGTERKNPEGKVVEILGHISDPGTDVLSIVKGYDLPTEFPEKVMNQAEKVPDAMVVAMERAQAAGLHNVFFVVGDAALLPDMFAPAEVDRLYINFCDPWPKSNQKRRRLTHGNFLKCYRQVLPMGGQIHFKTDNDKLFQWSVEEIPQYGFSLSEVTRDLHANGPVGVMTDYEAKFYELGKNINRCVATMEPWTEPEEEPAEAAPVEASSVE